MSCALVLNSHTPTERRLPGLCDLGAQYHSRRPLFWQVPNLLPLFTSSLLSEHKVLMALQMGSIVNRGKEIVLHVTVLQKYHSQMYG